MRNFFGSCQRTPLADEVQGSFFFLSEKVAPRFDNNNTNVGFGPSLP